MDRRDFLKTMCAGGAATFGFPTVRFAHVRQSGRLVFVLLRGGFDGLAAVVPYGDPAYRSLRGAFAFDDSLIMFYEDPDQTADQGMVSVVYDGGRTASIPLADLEAELSARGYRLQR